MSRHERYGTRDRGFSNWHRYGCDATSSMVDVDGLEYCNRRGCGRPLLLLESARDVGQPIKPVTAMRGLATAADIPAAVLLWTPSASWREEPPHCDCQAERRAVPGCDHGVESFRCQRIHPVPSRGWTRCAPEEIARWIDTVHRGHRLQMHEPIRPTEWGAA